MICIKDLWFSSRPSANVGHHGPPGSAREQPWIPRPHLRPGQDFNKRLEEICTRAEQDLLSLMIEQQGKNVSSDTQTINSPKGTLATMIPDQAKREQVERKIQFAANRSTFRVASPQTSFGSFGVRLSRIQMTSAGRLLSEPTNPNSQSERSRMQTTKTLN